MAARNTTTSAKAETTTPQVEDLEVAIETMEVAGATSGGRVKYSGTVEVDGGTVLVIAYIPAEVARKDLSVGIVGSGAKLQKAAEPKTAAPKGRSATAVARARKS